MFGFKYIKFDSMHYVIHHANGKVKREGRGLSFFYFSPNSSIAVVPLGSNDLPFIFTDNTKDFQEISIQGQLTYKVHDPKQLAELLDFTIDDRKRYVKDDYQKLEQRLINVAQTATATHVGQLSLKQALAQVEAIEIAISEGLRNSDAVAMLGVEILNVSVLAVKANPEMARALEAQTREALQQEADQAIYERRNFAVEQERKIKESELNTEIAIEEKQKQIAEKEMETQVVKQENDRKLQEMKMATQIAVEEQKQSLMEMQVENGEKEAKLKEKLLRANLEPYKELDWKMLQAMAGQNGDARTHIAMAFRELAENASNIGTLNITPELLETILKPARRGREN